MSCAALWHSDFGTRTTYSPILSSVGIQPVRAKENFSCFHAKLRCISFLEMDLDFYANV